MTQDLTAVWSWLTGRTTGYAPILLSAHRWKWLILPVPAAHSLSTRKRSAASALPVCGPASLRTRLRRSCSSAVSIPSSLFAAHLQTAPCCLLTSAAPMTLPMHPLLKKRTAHTWAAAWSSINLQDPAANPAPMMQTLSTLRHCGRSWIRRMSWYRPLSSVKSMSAAAVPSPISWRCME